VGSRDVSILAFGAAICVSCAPDFDTSRATPPRLSLGHELYSLVCDRVGAQALREDVTGASFHAVCHADPTTGAFADRVDPSSLVPLDPNAVDERGRLVPIEQQAMNRAHRIARVEALAHRREDFARAIDAAIPDETIAVKDLGAADPKKSCAPRPGDPARLRDELGATLGRLIDLYDDRTIPFLTEGLSDVMSAVVAAPDTQAALARYDARRGYRPLEVANGVARPALSYGRLAPLANSLLAAVSSKGKASGQTQQLFATLHEELASAVADPVPAPLAVAMDPLDGTRQILSRPRGSLELARQVLLSQDDAFRAGPPRWLVLRDPRGVAQVAALPDGALPSPFVDRDGDGLADLDALGQFVTSNLGGAPAPTPFFVPDGPRGASRDSAGRVDVYRYVDTKRTFLARALADLAPLFDPDRSHDRENVMGAVGGLPVLSGSRDEDARATRSYQAGAVLPYRAFHPEDSPLVDLVYAVGQVLASDTTDDTLALLRELADKHPNDLARLVGIGLEIKAIADRHPEARIPAKSTLWDDLLDTIAQIAQAPGLIEDFIRAFGKDETLALKDAFIAYVSYKDELTYDKANLNGPTFDLTTQSVGQLKTPVDRAKPDTGENRSALQRFMQLLHDANGLGACTKDGAIAHVVWKGIALDYPTDVTAQAACLLLTGTLPPPRLSQCGILRIENVDALLLDVALGRAKFDIRDPCLAKLVDSPLSGIVGGADAFLEEVSGIKGFSTHPTVNGVSRLVYYNTPHDGMAGDASNPKTLRFLKDIFDPVPSTVCPLTPFTDPSDGKVLQLRACASFADTIRGRDQGALFPLETLDFVKNVQPLAAAFADHGGALLFVDLFDKLHLHWGSNAQSTTECDPTISRKDARWCTQDGAVTYEPLLAEALGTQLFQVLHDAVPVLQAITVQHCTVQDPVTHGCTKATPKDGVSVLADAVRALVDPKRNASLTGRRGEKTARRNDGTTNPQTTPIYLLVDALNGFDAAFATHPQGGAAQANWKSARSHLVDTFLSVQGAGATARFANAAVPKILPTLVDALRAQLTAHCPDARSGAGCAWASSELSDKLAAVIRGPTFAATLDLVDAVRADDAARAELERLIQFLLQSSESDADAATISAAADMLQWLEDDANLVPLLHGMSAGFARARQHAFADAAIEVLARVLEKHYDADGAETCAREIDPDETLVRLLGHLMTPMAPDAPAPIEVLIDVVADVNRAHPELALADIAPKLEASDYASIAFEVKDFCANPSRGLEQVYEVIREATRP
jgi:hypothetical protein